MKKQLREQYNIYTINSIYVPKKYIIKKDIKKINTIDAKKGKLRKLIFEGDTKVSEIISPSLTEIHNYNGVINDELIKNCPNLNTIYFTKNTKLDLRYELKNKLKYIYLYYDSLNKHYLYTIHEGFKLGRVLNKYINNEQNIALMEENDKEQVVRLIKNPHSKPSEYRCLKQIDNSMIKDNKLCIDEEYDRIKLENLNNYQVNSIACYGPIHILGEPDKYNQIDTIQFYDLRTLEDCSLKKLKNLKYIFILIISTSLGVRNIKTEIPNDFVVDSINREDNNIVINCSNPGNEIKYKISYTSEVVKKELIINENSQYYNKENKMIYIPNGYDKLHINIKIDNINLTFCENDEKFPTINFCGCPIINKIYFDNGSVNKIAFKNIKIDSNIKSIHKLNYHYILANDTLENDNLEYCIITPYNKVLYINDINYSNLVYFIKKEQTDILIDSMYKSVLDKLPRKKIY